MMFISISIQIFTIYRENKEIKLNDKDSEGNDYYKLHSRNNHWFLRKKLDFKDWYFSLEYQISFTLSIFTSIFVLSNA